MCLILLAHDVHPKHRLILAANRDEYYDRPATPAAFWPEAEDILAGRDLVGGGTWLGVSRSGRLAAVANFRDPADRRTGTRSRGLLVPEFLLATAGASSFLQEVARQAGDYRGFNLLVGEGEELAFFSSREGRVRPLAPGIHGFSNGPLDAPWPKVEKGKKELLKLLARGGEVEPRTLFRILADRTLPADTRLPDTGVGLARERILAPAFIVSSDYGTRSSTVLLLDRSGEANWVERTYDRSPERWREVGHAFSIPSRGEKRA